MKYEIIALVLIFLILIPVTIIDIKIKKIPDIFTYPGIVAFVVIKSIMKIQPFYEIGLLVLLGFLPFFFIWLFTRGKLGLGDAKLSAFLSLALGVEGWLGMVFFSSVSGLVFAVVMLISKKMDKNTQIPFAPFMCLGTIISMIVLN